MSGDTPTVEVDTEAIPEELKQRDQWLLWGRKTPDRPKQPHWKGDRTISWSDPDDWHTFDEAVEAARSVDEWGIGYVCAAENADHARGIYGVIDVDGGVDESGSLKEWVPSLSPFYDREAFVEFSPSGSGLHIPVAGFDVPEWWKDAQFPDREHEGVDVLANKFCTFTGDRERGAGDDVVDYGEWVDEWLADAYEALTGETAPPRRNTRLGSHGSGGGHSGGESRSYDDGSVPRETVEQALEALPGNQHFNDWIRTGYAVYSWDDGDRGKAVFEDWSRTNPKWESDESQRQIDYIWSEGDSDGGGDGNASLGTLFHLAKQHGWEPSGRSGPPRWKELVVENDERYDSVDEVPDDPIDLETGSTESSEQHATADGGTAASAWDDADPPDYASELTQDAMKIVAEVDQDESIRDLDDREKAAGVWELCRRSNDVHVRVRSDNDELWSYDGGVWKDKGERTLRYATRRAVGGAAYGSNVLNEVKAQARADPVAEVDERQFGLEAGELGVKNGLLDLDGRAAGDRDPVRELRPDDYALTRLPVSHDPDAEPDLWLEFLSDVAASPDTIDKLQEYLGYCLLHDQPFGKALFLVGPTDSGKGTVLKTLKAILGEENVANQSLKDLVETRWGKAHLYGNMVNIRNEITPGSISDVNEFKELTGGEDSVSAEKKGEQKFEFTVTQKFLFATNQFPEFEGADGAFWNRCLFARFPNTIPDEDQVPQFHNRLLEERSGILNWMLDGLERLREQERFTGERTLDEKQNIAEESGDALDRFKQNAMEITREKSHLVHARDLYDFVAAYADKIDMRNSLPPFQGGAFTNALSDWPGIGTMESRRIVDSGSATAYTGIRIDQELATRLDVDVRTDDQTGNAQTSL